VTPDGELVELEPTIPAADGRGERRDSSEYEDLQRVTRSIAFGGGWSPERAERIAQFFDGLAPEWHTRGGPERAAPLRDALLRGGAAEGGRALEIGSGTGLHTPMLAAHFAQVISVDLAPQMLALSPRGVARLVRADAALLPFRDGAVDAVVCVNAFLFPAEYGRVLASAGVLIFASTFGDETPIYLAPVEVLAALPGDWQGVTSKACWGTWTVARRRIR
jgi:SAM-dependent methyltransferase